MVAANPSSLTTVASCRADGRGNNDAIKSPTTQWGDVIQQEETRSEMNEQQAMDKFKEAIKELPPGWHRNPKTYTSDYIDINSGKEAPYFHDDGRQSWRNPALAKIRKVMAEYACQQDMENNKQRLQAKFWKKYRMMIRSGMPMLAVQHTARLHGVDPILLENPTLVQERRFWKRYHLMIKSGVPRLAVDQASRLFGADLLPKRLKDEDSSSWAALSAPAPTSRSLAGANVVLDSDYFIKKYTKLYKVGVSKRAIESMAQREVIGGYSKRKQLLETVFSAGTTVAAETLPATTDHDAEVENTDTNADKEEHPIFFEPRDDANQVEFPSNLHGSDAYLGLLVRQLVKSSNVIYAGNEHFVVDKHALQHVLGNLKDAQEARDSYNSTLEVVAVEKQEAIEWKQAPLLELWDNLGIRKPTMSTKEVRIKGLDQLVVYLEEQESGADRTVEAPASVALSTCVDRHLSAVPSSTSLQGGNGDDGRTRCFDYESLGRLYRPGVCVACATDDDNGVVVWNRYEENHPSRQPSFQVGIEFSVKIGGRVTSCQVVETVHHFEGQRHIESLTFLPVPIQDQEDPPSSLHHQDGELVSPSSCSQAQADPLLSSNDRNLKEDNDPEEDAQPVELVEAMPLLQPSYSQDSEIVQGLFEDENAVTAYQQDATVMETAVTWEETEEAITVTLEVPGFGIDQLQVSLRDFILTVHGVRQDGENEGGLLEFHEELMLGSAVYNADEIQALFTKEILTILIPKFQNVIPETREIPISPLMEVDEAAMSHQPHHRYLDDAEEDVKRIVTEYVASDM